MEVAAISEQSTASIETVSANTEIQFKEINEYVNMANRLASVAATLDDLIGNFKLS